ncbi:hypothetical protein PM082_004112 [Marasmius tenuissimus]|nr:hypothetical protein PM082_004112 [Marasmius tenuissimus]
MRSGSNYLDFPSDSRSPNASPPGMPSDAEIENAVSGILSNVDLNTVTKRELRRQLEEHFGMDLTAKKGVINQVVNRCLAEQAQGRRSYFFSSPDSSLRDSRYSGLSPAVIRYSSRPSLT